MSSADFQHLHADPARLAHVMEVVRTAARALIGADGVTLVFRDGKECAYVEEDAIGPLWKGQRFPLTECVSGWVIMHETPATRVITTASAGLLKSNPQVSRNTALDRTPVNWNEASCRRTI